MRHLARGRKFGRERNVRRALMKSLAASFFLHGRVKTTEAKAKELRPFVEKIITRARATDLAATRSLVARFSPTVVRKIQEQTKTVEGRSGGYTRIVKLGARKSDSARMAFIEMMK